MSDNIHIDGVLPHGVIARSLDVIADERGSLTEVFRQSWVDAPAPPVQWNAVTSASGVMRGMHIHLGYFEYYVVMQGDITVGYRDTRPRSPTEGATALVRAKAAPGRLAAIAAPPGIVHGIYTHAASILFTAMTRYWDTAQETGCHWRDPALGIAWPFDTAVTSGRDGTLPPLAQVQHLVPPFDRR